jgi:hypothetical protein
LVPTSFKTSERIKVVLGGSSQLDKRVSKIPKERIPSEAQVVTSYNKTWKYRDASKELWVWFLPENKYAEERCTGKHNTSWDCLRYTETSDQ